jgi:regulator of sigma D
MKTNIGVAKSFVSKQLMDSLMNKKNIGESKKLAAQFFDVIKESPLLQLEFKIFNNLENKYIENDVFATRYVDNNINLFEKYSLEEIDAEHQKLTKFIGEDIDFISKERMSLYEGIENMLRENANKNMPDVDLLHESFTNVVEYIKTNTTEEENTITENLNIPEEYTEKLIEIAIDKFNEKYSSLNEDELKLVQKLISLDSKGKENLLNQIKEDVIKTLETGNNNGIEDKINETIDRINKIQFNESTVVTDISNLYEFKKNLI